MSPKIDLHAVKAAEKPLAETVQAGSIEAVAIDELHFDHAYQRDVSVDLIQQMAAEWDIAVAGTIVVSRRPNGDLFVVDGQHRCAAAKMAGETHILAQVLQDQGREQEARRRLRGNVRRGDRVGDRFKAQVAAKDPESLAIVKLCGDFDTKVNYTPVVDTGINALAALEFVYDRDKGVLLTRVFEVVQRSWGRVGGENAGGAVLKGLAWMLEKHAGEVDVGRLVERMQAEGPDGVGRKARAHKAAMGGSLWLNWYRAAVEAYNQRLPEGSRLEWRTGGWSKAGRGGGSEGWA